MNELNVLSMYSILDRTQTNLDFFLNSNETKETFALFHIQSRLLTHLILLNSPSVVAFSCQRVT